MANHGHDRRTGRFITRAQRRTQAIQGIAEQPDADYALDEAAQKILEEGIARAILRGWVPPAEVELEPQP